MFLGKKKRQTLQGRPQKRLINSDAHLTSPAPDLGLGSVFTAEREPQSTANRPRPGRTVEDLVWNHNDFGKVDDQGFAAVKNDFALRLLPANHASTAPAKHSKGRA